MSGCSDTRGYSFLVARPYYAGNLEVFLSTSTQSARQGHTVSSKTHEGSQPTWADDVVHNDAVHHPGMFLRSEAGWCAGRLGGGCPVHPR